MNVLHVFRAVRTASVVALAVCALGLPQPIAAADQPLEKLRIVVIPTEIAAGAYYANDLGYFKDAGIDAEIVSLQSGAAATTAVLSGAADIGFSNTLSLILAHDKGLPVNILSGTDMHRKERPAQGYLAVLKNSPLKTAKDFNGKTIAVGSLAITGYYALRKWIDDNGGDSKTVKYVEMPLPVQADAIIAGKIDAAPLDAANMYAARSKASLRLVASVYDAIAPKFVAGAWFSTPSWTEKHPELSKKFVAVFERVSNWANAHQAESAQLYSKHSSFSLEDLKLAPRAQFEPTTSLELMQPVIDVALKYGAIKKSFHANDMLSSAAVAAPAK